MSLEPFKNKWEAFGWSVEEIDGHNMDQIVKALSEASTGTPKLILSNSIKGKGISFMENDNHWHGGGSIGKFSKEALSEVEDFSKFPKLYD